MKIRASMLPGWNDCARRAAAKQYRSLISEAGFELRELRPSIGAAVGTATHAGAEYLLRAKMAGVMPDQSFITPAAHAGVEKLRKEIAPGAEWDDTTMNLQTAEDQIWRMTNAYLPIAREVTPIAVELELKAEVAGFEVSGHLDALLAGGRIDDLKTGALKRPHQAQLGCYALLAQANGYDVKEIGTTYVPRGKKTKPQPPAERDTYDLETAKRAAWTTIHAVKSAVQSFSETGDPYAFAANPMSLMCSARYCPAWGTEFCKLHLPKKQSEQSID